MKLKPAHRKTLILLLLFFDKISNDINNDYEIEFISFYYNEYGTPHTRTHKDFILKRKKFIELCQSIGVIPMISIEQVIKFYSEERR